MYLLTTNDGVTRPITLEEIPEALQAASFVSLQGNGEITWSGITDTSILGKNPNVRLATKEFEVAGVRAKFLSTHAKLDYKTPYQVGVQVSFLITAFQSRKKVYSSKGVTFENGKKFYNFKELKIISSSTKILKNVKSIKASATVSA
jgi:hypothetical protein